MLSDVVQIVRVTNPFEPRSIEYCPSGLTVADYVGGQEPLSAELVVHVARGSSVHPVPGPLRRCVRPKPGSIVTVAPTIAGRKTLGFVAGIALSFVSFGAGSLLFGSAGILGTSAIGAAAVSAGVAIAGSLAINALIPPVTASTPFTPFTPFTPAAISGGAVSQATATQPVYDISGSTNQVLQYGRVPLIAGRHLMTPPKTALPFSPTFETVTVLHERFCLGYGPMKLESLTIGETPIHQFEGVEVEFRNVDQAKTLAAYPEIASRVVGWRQGGEVMTLYTADMAEDRYSVRLLPDVQAVRTTRLDTVRAEVEVSLPSGLGVLLLNGAISRVAISWRVAYRLAGSGGGWIVASSPPIDRAQREPFRITSVIDFPYPAQWEIGVTRTAIDQDQTPQGEIVFDDTYLSAVRSVASTNLPSDPNLAEIAVRIRATEQLNGPLSDLRAVVTRLVPVWNGTTWTAPQETRHPAWVYADILRGPMRSKPVPDTLIDADGLRRWEIEDPGRTCDYVFNGSETVRDALKIVAAAGRARAHMPNGKYGVARDRSNGPLVQVFTPRNIVAGSFESVVQVPREVHAFRATVMSEVIGWQRDDVLIYADGYNAANATEIERLDLPGVVIEAGATDAGNAWRDGRYHLAQYKLRPETFEFVTDLEHLVCELGDRVRLIHDAVSIGVGAARVADLQLTDGIIDALVLDTAIDAPLGNYKLTVRLSFGPIFEIVATGGGGGFSWVPVEPTAASGIAAGDLIAIEEPVGSFDVVVTQIVSLDGEQARIKAVAAAPEVLSAEFGVIPPYEPRISRIAKMGRPEVPQVLRAFSGPEAALRQYGRTDVARIGVEIGSLIAGNVPPTHFRLRWRLFGQTEWQMGTEVPVSTIAFTDSLQRGQTYDLQVQALSNSVTSDGWSSTQRVFAYVDDQVGTVRDFRATVLGAIAHLNWSRPSPNVDFYEIRHSTLPSASWGEAQQVEREIRGTSTTVPAANGVYHIRATNLDGVRSATSATVLIDSGSLLAPGGATLAFHPTWAGTPTGGVLVQGGNLEFSGSANDIGDWSDIALVDNIATFDAQPSAGSYEMAEQSDLGTVQTVRIAAEIRAGGAYAGYMIETWSDLSDVSDISGGADDTWQVAVQISTTQDGGGSPTWGEWRDLVAGDFTYRMARFRVRCEQDETAVTVTVSELTVTVGAAA